MRAESAVEPTRSENITVTWRRSAVSSWARRSRCRSRNGDGRVSGFEARQSRAAFCADPEKDA